MASNFPPRPRNTLGFSLGAVGGPRGTGAGVARVLTQFVTQYDKGQLEQLSRDLAVLKQQQAQANADLLAASTRQKAIEDEITRARQARLNLDSQAQKALKAMLDIQARARAEEQTLGRVTQQTTATLLQREKTFRAINGLTAQQSAALINQVAHEQQLKVAVTQTNAAREQAVGIEQQVNATMEQGIGLASMRAAAFAQIQGLVQGAIGGIVGGAIVGALFYEPLQNFVNGIKDMFSSFLDPAQAAKEAIDDIGKSIADAASSENITRLQAVQNVLDKMGGNQASGDAGRFLKASDVTILQDIIDGEKKRLDITAGVDSQYNEITRQLAEQQQFSALIASADDAHQAQLATSLRMAQQLADLYAGIGFPQVRDFLDQQLGATKDLGANLAEADTKAYDNQVAAEQAAAAWQDAADAAADMRQELAQSNISAVSEQFVAGIRSALDATSQSIRNAAEADIGTIRNNADAAVEHIHARSDARIKSLQRQAQNLELRPSRRTQNLEGALKALNDAGPSRRTRELADAIEHLNDVQDKAAFRAQLADIDERKRQILLAQRLANTKEQIDIERYQGRDRLLAIDALLARMQKVNEAQDRFNKLLDIQYQISQGVHRQQGETIQDFIRRRAQYYRGLLTQAAELRREGPQAELEAEKDRVQRTIDLRELEAQKKKLIEDRARERYLASLQNQLQASQERDRKELEHRKAMLQAQLEASKKADQDALQARRQALQDQMDAVRKNTQAEIDSINKRRDQEIKAREQARDRAVQLAQDTAEKAIKAEQQRAELLKKWADYGETARLIEAFKGARSIAELQSFSGALSGALYTLNYLRQSGQWTGLDPGTQQALLTNYSRATSAYIQKLSSFYARPAAPPTMPTFSHGGGGGAGGGFLEGGAFMMRNSQQNPFSNNIRFGEDGRDEIGVVLSNKVVQAFREGRQGGGNSLIGGDMNIVTSENPYRAREAWERRVRSIVREELKN